MADDVACSDGIAHNRFYLCDNGESVDAFLVCGYCLERNERDTSLYDELAPLPESAIENGHTRSCMVCDRVVCEVETDTEHGATDD